MAPRSGARLLAAPPGAAARGKLAVAALTALLLASVAFGTLYLPYFSRASFDRKADVAVRREAEAAAEARKREELASGSVWRNMAKRRDATARHE